MTFFKCIFLHGTCCIIFKSHWNLFPSVQLTSSLVEMQKTREALISTNDNFMCRSASFFLHVLCQGYRRNYYCSCCHSHCLLLLLLWWLLILISHFWFNHISMGTFMHYKTCVKWTPSITPMGNTWLTLNTFIGVSYFHEYAKCW